MTKIMLWPDLHREDGHWLPAVNLAKTLIDAGYEVEAMGIPDTEAIATPYQITFNTILADWFPLGSALKRVEEGLNPWDHLMPLARGELDSLFSGAGAPAVLVAGYFTALESLILHHKYSIPLVILTTFLRAPQLSPYGSAHETLLALPRAVRLKFIETVTGNADMSVEDFLEPLSTVPEMIPMVKDFDFKDRDWKHESHVQYVEPMIERVRMDGTLLPPPTVDYFHDLPGTGDVLYGAAGSQVEVFESSARQFFSSLIQMMEGPGMTNKHLVLSLGRKLHREFLNAYTSDGALGTKALPSNVSLAAWVPQQEILSRADAVFIHGGLATIKETIAAGKPIVIVPMINDQFDNALRIEREELGVILEIQRLTGANLRAAYVKATTGPWFARAVASMKQKLDAERDRVPRRSVEILQGIALP